MNNINDIVRDYALRLGIAPSVAGFNRFIEVVEFCASYGDEYPICSVCEKIGEKHSLKARAIHREIDYAIKTADNLRGRIYDLFGLKIRQEDVRLKYIINLVACYVKHELEL